MEMRRHDGDATEAFLLVGVVDARRADYRSRRSFAIAAAVFALFARHQPTRRKVEKGVRFQTKPTYIPRGVKKGSDCFSSKGERHYLHSILVNPLSLA